MALSNIFKEPRRELTESAIGFVLFGVPAVAVGWLTCKFATVLVANQWSPHDYGVALIVASIWEFLGFFVIWGSLFVAHAIGQSFCNWLAKKGIELRPLRRYR